MKEYKTAIYIGRFQPFHNAHAEIIRKGLEIADTVVTVVGSSNAAPNLKNPFSLMQRKKMIYDSLDITIRPSRTPIVGVRDYYYNESSWLADVQSKTKQWTDEGPVVLIGSFKDGSSYYLNMFPQWDFVGVRDTTGIDATKIRDSLFDFDLRKDWEGKASTTPDISRVKPYVPENVYEFLLEYIKTPEYFNIVQEFQHIKEYKASWASAPFPPTFVTTDAIVICSGHVLVVKRKSNPGKGLYALPGGFIKQNEFIEDAAIRELKEETRIKIDKAILKASIVDRHIFDDPGRSLRGRTISHGFLIKLRDGNLPEVKGSDDAEQAFWMPLMDVARNEEQFFEDHFHIIHYFINKT